MQQRENHIVEKEVKHVWDFIYNREVTHQNTIALSLADKPRVPNLWGKFKKMASFSQACNQEDQQATKWIIFPPQ